MILAGLDVATVTGFAILKGDSYVTAGAFHWQGKTSGEVFRHCRRIIYKMIDKYQITHVGVEQPLRTDIELPGRALEDGSTGPATRPPMKTFQRIYGLCAVVEEVCAAQSVDHRYINQGTWRKAFTGNGHATKQESLAYAQLIDRTITSLDAAEALGVAWCLRGLLDPRYAVPRGDLFDPQIPQNERTPF
ncbi:hypothetical protein OOZ54_12660 [Rhodopseudomonas palustris]|uniref:hypothetical protein n=1 Tax=Rhodopseudomonas palustris TaxID=1076 RepID=UPI0022F0FC48|nr:hypothetical protein [Rhodopseudomonas palustris]WBU27546.1 hypothetical protein OOZ54_12660 [Rhodopseudomonas palustris]